MRARDIIGLVVALLLAIGVAFLTRMFLSKEDKTSEIKQGEQVGINKILVAKVPLLQGSVVKAGDLVWQEWPQTGMSETYIKEGTQKVEDFIGSVVKDPFVQGEPVVASALVKPGDKSILAALVSPGMRAISIDVTSQSASSGLIAPGDFVDVILSKVVTPPGGGNQYGQSQTIVSNVKVLAIDIVMEDAHEKPKNAPRVATLEVTPNQAEILTASMKNGTLSLSLHSIENAEMPQNYQVNKPQEQEDTIILMRGKEKTEVKIQE